MRCEEVKSLIDLHVAGELAEEMRVAIVEHLKTCPLCAEQEEASLRLSDHLSKAFQTLNPPSGLATRIMGACQDRSSYLRRAIVAFAAAAVLLMGLTTWFILTKSGLTPPESGLLEDVPPQEYTFPDGSHILVAPGTIWEEKEAGSKILLQQGNLYLNIVSKGPARPASLPPVAGGERIMPEADLSKKRPASGTAFTIITPAGTITVYGTEFSVRVDRQMENKKPDSYEVSVLIVNGVVELSNSLGNVVGSHGESLYAEENSPPKKQSH